jgi:hypothetical protein
MFYRSLHYLRDILVTLILVLFTSIGYALDTTIRLQADTAITPTNTELVTFGLPLALGDVTDIAQLCVLDSGRPVPYYAEPGLRWHWRDNSLRSITLQVVVDLTVVNNKLLTITDTACGGATLTRVDPLTGWIAAPASKGSVKYPRVFALHDLPYIASTGLVAPFQPGTATDQVSKLQISQFTKWAGALNYATSPAEAWLFDRSSSMFKAYLGSGDVRFLKEAILAKQFYFARIKNDGTSNDGCFPYAGVNCADGKYIYTQPAKLAWALLGDNSQWDNALLIEMATTASTGNYQPGTDDPFDAEGEPFTERAAGITGLAEVATYEITGNAAIKARMDARIGSLQDMQQNAKPWDAECGWAKSGAFDHSWAVHEGDHSQGSLPHCYANDRRFSPWMSENIADFLWQAYSITEDVRVPEMLRRLGNAIDQYGFASTSGTFVRKPGATTLMNCGFYNSNAVDIFYSGSASASMESLSEDSSYTDQHNVEVVLPLALAYHFETDPAVKQRLLARIQLMVAQWTMNPISDCSGIFAGVNRIWNWQNRSAALRTYGWVMAQQGVSVYPAVAPVPLEPPLVSGTPQLTTAPVLAGWVQTATGECKQGQSWHWQCGNLWKPGAEVALNDLIAVCKAGDGKTCGSTDRLWLRVLNIQPATTLIKLCAVEPTNLTNKDSCPVASTTYATMQAVPPVVIPPIEPPPVIPPVVVPPVSSTAQPPVFRNVTADWIDHAGPVDFTMTAVAADTNNDGCIDLFNGSHQDNKNSAMFMNDCFSKFTNYFSPTFSQATPVDPRVTSSHWLANLTANALGLPSLTGNDADQNTTALYKIAGLTDGKPTYLPKEVFCRAGGCLPFERDGRILLASSLLTYMPDNVTIRDKFTRIHTVDGALVETLNNNALRLGVRSIIFDVNGDTFSDFVYPADCAYRLYNPATKTYDLKTDVFKPCPPEAVMNAGVGHMVPGDFFDHDADFDLYLGIGTYGSSSVTVRNVVKGGNVFYKFFYRYDDGIFVEQTEEVGLGIPGLFQNMPIFTTYANSMAGDLNNDGKLDVIFCAERSGHRPTSGYTQIPLVLNDGAKFVVDRSNNFDAFTNQVNNAGRPRCARADLDGDFDLDIVKTAGNTGCAQTVADCPHQSIAVFENTTVNTHHAMTMRVQGRTTDGIGSTVTTRKAGTDQVVCYDQVGFPHSGIMNLVLHCGLGQVDKVDVTVAFANGGPVYAHKGLDVDQSVIFRLDGSIVTHYTPGINPLLAPADAAEPPEEEPPVEEPELTYDELLSIVEELRADVLRLVGEKQTVTVANEALQAQTVTLTADVSRISATLTQLQDDYQLLETHDAAQVILLEQRRQQVETLRRDLDELQEWKPAQIRMTPQGPEIK